MNISMEPRTIVTWHGGERKEYSNIIPQKFGRERATKIVEDAKASAVGTPWLESIHRFMTLREEAYVLAVWDTMPGNTCWYDAFCRICRET